MTIRYPRFVALGFSLVLASCGGEGLTLPPEGAAANIEVLAEGNEQNGRVDQTLAKPLVVLVTDSRARPVAGANVVFTFTNGVPAQAIPAEATTDAAGLASVELKLGSLAGPIIGMAEVPVAQGIRPVQAAFSATALPADANGIAMVSGNDQSGTINTALAAPLVVKVTDLAGNPIPGQAIVWTAETGGGSVSEGNTITGADGQTSVIRILGSTAGEQTTSATAAGLAGSPVVFTHTATAGTATGVVKFSGDNQSGSPGAELALPVVVQVLDGAGNPIPNRPLTWTIGEGGGTVPSANTITDAEGKASTTWTLGPSVGVNTLNAVVSGLAPATFTATATAGTPSASNSTVVVEDNDITVGSSTRITVTVLDASNNPVSGASISVTSGAGTTITPPTASSGGNGVATFTFSSAEGGAKTITATAGGVTIDEKPTITVRKVASRTRIVSFAPETSTEGEEVRVNFTVTSDDAGTPGGDVTVTANGSSGPCTGSVEVGFCNIRFTAVGNHQVVARYTGDSRYAVSQDDDRHQVTPNLPPVAADDTYNNAVEDTPLTVNAADGVLKNDTDPEGGPLTAVIASDPANGSVVLNADGSFTYTPNSNFAGSDGFTYSAKDGAGNSDIATVTIQVAPVNDPPAAGFNPPICTVNVPCQFTDGSTHPDADGTIVSWTWQFGDSNDPSPGSDKSGPAVEHTFTATGSYIVTLTVTDNRGASDDVPNQVDVFLTPQGVRLK